MAGSMTLPDLVADLKASLQSAAAVFVAAADADFARHVQQAALAFHEKRPRTLLASLTLVADQHQYAAPADFLSFKNHLWGITPTARPKPWDVTWPGVLPKVFSAEVAAGTNKLTLEPSPSANQIAVLGSDFRYYYFAAHSISASDTNLTTIRAGERGLLLLRAQAEAMKEVALRNSAKPVTMRDGYSGMAREGMPGSIADALMKAFKEAPLP